jgi:RNA 3'-terminal phosphate cyclase (ATP)
MTAPDAELVIDGSHGEGGGQILRTALSLSAITGRALRVENIRAGRPKPGLAAQHVTAVRALAAVCDAEVRGDELGSQVLGFAPGAPVRAGDYAFDVGAARVGGSAGAVTLVLQAVLLPLACAEGNSGVTVRGGTHMAWSPPYDYVAEVWLPMLARLGVAAQVALRRSGWFPIGQGEVRARVQGHGRAGRLRPVELAERGALQKIAGRAIAANLPEHIPARMAAAAAALLEIEGVPLTIAPVTLAAACAGAGLFLTAHYERLRCGFSALGERSKPAETVAAEAAGLLVRHRKSGAAMEVHLADQSLLPLALAAGTSRFTVERVSRHLATNAWVIERFGLARIAIEGVADGTGRVTVTPRAAA